MNDKELLTHLAKCASKGDDDCFVQLCDTLKSRLFYTAKGILGEESLALDAVSEAVFRAYKGIKRLREPQYVGTWFTRIILNVSKDMHKRKMHEITVNIMPEGRHIDNYDELNFNELIENLPLELREIVSLKYYSEYTLIEISTILKIPEGTVKSRLNRALKMLRLEVSNE